MGLQALFTVLCPLAQHVGYVAHELNLVGKCTVESVLETGMFFDYLEDFYNFISNVLKCTKRWELLFQKLKLGHKVAKRVSGTQWFSH